MCSKFLFAFVTFPSPVFGGYLLIGLRERAEGYHYDGRILPGLYAFGRLIGGEPGSRRHVTLYLMMKIWGRDRGK